jgi:hypothetical protein
LTLAYTPYWAPTFIRDHRERADGDDRSRVTDVNLDGWYYDFYLEAHDGYEARVVRSRDLVHWDASPLNPVLKASAEDKQIANPKLTAEERERIAKADNINNSDIDFCQYKGKLVINYSWGNQQGKEFLAQAEYDGTAEQFLTGWFPPAREVK